MTPPFRFRDGSVQQRDGGGPSPPILAPTLLYPLPMALLEEDELNSSSRFPFVEERTQHPLVQTHWVSKAVMMKLYVVGTCCLYRSSTPSLTCRAANRLLTSVNADDDVVIVFATQPPPPP